MAPTDTASSKKLEVEKQKNSEKANRLKKQLKQKLTEENGLKKVINRIDYEMALAERELAKVRRDLEKLKAEGAYLDKQYTMASEEFSQYRNKYQERLVAYYKNGHAGYMEVLFNSTSFSDFISRMYYLQLLTQHDQEVLDRLKELRETMKKKKAMVEDNTKNVEYHQAVLVQKKDYNNRLHQEKKKMLVVAQGERRTLEEELEILERENRRIEAQLRAAKDDSSLGPFTGQFGSPVCGARFHITSSFGWRRSPRRGASSNHKGIDIDTNYDQDICAAADGEVFAAEYGSGYGYHVIIRHGSGYATVYAHARRNLVSVGQKVKRGQVIQKSDSTGISTGNHLHFEIRKDGVAVNPMSYF